MYIITYQQRLRSEFIPLSFSPFPTVIHIIPQGTAPILQYIATAASPRLQGRLTPRNVTFALQGFNQCVVSAFCPAKYHHTSYGIVLGLLGKNKQKKHFVSLCTVHSPIKGPAAYLDYFSCWKNTRGCRWVIGQPGILEA